MSNRTCSQCGETKPLTREYWYTHLKNGWRSQCKMCMCLNQRAYDISHGRSQAEKPRGLNRAAVKIRNQSHRERNKNVVRDFKAELDREKMSHE